MTTGARSPEELETLLEDAFVLGDAEALAGVFHDGAVVLAGDGAGNGAGAGVLAGQPAGGEARGVEEIVALATASRAGGRTYVAGPARVLQARDTALIVGRGGTSVARRDADGTWRFALCLVALEEEQRAERGGAMTQHTQSMPALEPVAVATEEGEARWWFDALAVIRATAADTGGQMTIVEMTEPPGAQAPLHVHHREDEAFWILEGEVTLEVGDATIHAKAGDYAFGPRDIPHRYTVGEHGCRMLFICTPGGFEDLVREMSRPAERRTLPPPLEGLPDFERIGAVARANGCELLEG